jgi:hypothetical protein
MAGVLASCEAFLLDPEAAPLSGGGGPGCVWRWLLAADQLLHSDRVADRWAGCLAAPRSCSARSISLPALD